MIFDLVNESKAKNIIMMSKTIRYATDQLREFMFEKVYIGSRAKGEEDKAKYIITSLFDYFKRNYHELPEEFVHNLDDDGIDRIVCDYIAGMTDIYAINMFSKLFIPSPWR
jgi:dGTPase